jgi:hypothetical protein
MVCSTPAAERVRGLTGPATQVIIDDRALDKRAIEMLAAILVGQDGGGTIAPPPPAGKRLSLRPSRRGHHPARRPLSVTSHEEGGGN